MNIIRIAIDGPSGAGKSTIAKLIAMRKGIDYIDTGSMYRAIAYKMLLQNIALTDSTRLATLLNETSIDFTSGNIILDGEIINDKIRTQEISKLASDASALADVRSKLVDLQRRMGDAKSVVMDGRDIGTNVLKDAEYKFFLTASAEDRAHRRWLELRAKGEKPLFEIILAEIQERDINDTTRKLNPLRQAEDAVLIDSTGKTIEEVTQEILERIQ
jgi:cytidylate kinase